MKIFTFFQGKRKKTCQTNKHIKSLLWAHFNKPEKTYTILLKGEKWKKTRTNQNCESE